MTGWTRPGWARMSELSDLIRLAVPIAVSRMSVMLMAVTDAIVLGQMAGHELPYVLNAWLPIGVSLGFGMGILLGVQVLTSEHLGRGEAAHTGRIFRRGFIWAVLLGVGLTGLVYLGVRPLFEYIFINFNNNASISDSLTPQEVVDNIVSVTRILSYGLLAFMLSTVCSLYLEALRRPVLVSIIMYVGVLVNLLIDLALVAGWWGMPQLGAEGVAWATTGSRITLTLGLLILVAKLTPALQPSPPGPADEPMRQLKVGFGTAISNVAEWGGFNFSYVIAALISLAANAIYGFTVQVMGICFMLFLGIASASSVRVAERFGQHDFGAVRDACRLGVFATFAVGLPMSVLIWFFRDSIALVLVAETARIDGYILAPAISALLIYAALATTFDGLQATASMALRAQEIVWLPTLIHAASFFAGLIPGAYFLGITLERGAQGMMEAVLISLLVAGFLQWALLEWKTTRQL